MRLVGWKKNEEALNESIKNPLPSELNKYLIEVGDVFELTMNKCYDFAGMDTVATRKYKAIERHPKFMLCKSLEGPPAAHHNRAIDYFTLQFAKVLNRKQ